MANKSGKPTIIVGPQIGEIFGYGSALAVQFNLRSDDKSVVNRELKEYETIVHNGITYYKTHDVYLNQAIAIEGGPPTSVVLYIYRIYTDVVPEVYHHQQTIMKLIEYADARYAVSKLEKIEEFFKTI